jgi:hypothetical protein
VFKSFGDDGETETVRRPVEEHAAAQDPTTIKAQETNPFSGE